MECLVMPKQIEWMKGWTFQLLYIEWVGMLCLMVWTYKSKGTFSCSYYLWTKTLHIVGWLKDADKANL